jgi:uncharacterized repeat protein (TIGR02543 family)
LENNVAYADISEGTELAYIKESKFEETVTFGEKHVLPIPVKNGYIFDGWYHDGVKVESGEWDIDQDITLVANWIPIE